VITNIINAGIECGKGPITQVADRIGFYQRYCGILGVGTGINLDCYNQHYTKTSRCRWLLVGDVRVGHELDNPPTKPSA
jgi:hypothetical protein